MEKHITMPLTKEIVEGSYQITGVQIIEGQINNLTANIEGQTIKVTIPNDAIPADLKLIKRIVAVNNQNILERIENVDVSKLNSRRIKGRRQYIYDRHHIYCKRCSP